MFKWAVILVLLSCAISIVYYDRITVLNNELPDEIYSAFHRLFITPPFDSSTNDYYRDPLFYPEWWEPPLSVYDAILHLGFELVVIYVGMAVLLVCSMVVFVGETIKNLIL